MRDEVKKLNKAVSRRNGKIERMKTKIAGLTEMIAIIDEEDFKHDGSNDTEGNR